LWPFLMLLSFVAISNATEFISNATESFISGQEWRDVSRDDREDPHLSPGYVSFGNNIHDSDSAVFRYVSSQPKPMADMCHLPICVISA
jgi:hypothetical protein